MRNSKKKTIIHVDVPKERKGHYNYQGGKTKFDNRPKRLRTREEIERKNIDEWEG